MEASLVDLFRRHAAERPDAPCLVFQGNTLTYRELDERSNRLANALAQKDVGEGDRVAIVARNSPVFYELAYACAKIGAIMLPINWRLSAREAGLIIRDATPRVVLSGTEQQALIPADTHDAEVIEIDTEYPRWRDAGLSCDPYRQNDPDDVWLLLYTSGTTGAPKGAMLTHRNLSFTANMARDAWRFTADSVNLVAMPLFHIGGIGYGMMALSQGGQTLLFQQPDPERMIDAIRTHGVTHGFFVPAVIQALANVDDVDSMDLSSLELIAYGAAPISETLLLRALEVFKCDFSHAYGLTEAAGTVIRLAPEDHDPGGANSHRLKACGLPLPWAEVGLFDPERGEHVPQNQVGEIWIRSEMNMRGYWRKPDETAATLTPEGWLRTGDLAYQDGDGYIYIHDRYKDMIVSGGENIYPAEIENVLYEHAEIAEAAVIGVRHARWGETPKAVIVPVPESAPTEAGIIAFLRDRLAHYKCPTSVEFVSELPRNASGKLLKRTLREMYCRQHENRI